MPEFKLPTSDELFPDKAEKLKEKDKKTEYGHMFKLSDEDKKSVIERIISTVDEMKRQREPMLAIKTESVRNYEGIEEIHGPWKGSSNISTMVTTISADMMHAKLFPMVWNPESLHFIGVEQHDDQIAEWNEILIRWALTKDMEGTQDKIDDCLHRLVIDGTLCVKQVWEIYYTYVTNKIPKSVNDAGEIQYEVEYDNLRRERCRWIVKDLDHVYFTFNAENEQRAEIIEELYLTLPMLNEMQACGLILPDVDLESVKTSCEKTFDPQGTIRARYEAVGVEAYYAQLNSYPIKAYEAYIPHSFGKDKIRKECVFLILPDQKVYLSGKPLHCISRIGKKPWIIRPFLRRPGTLIGKGVPELVRHLHREMNAIHNQRIDAGNMVIAPFFFYRTASGLEPEEISIRPATGIPLDDPSRDIVFPDYNASRLSVTFQEEGILMDLIEKLTFLTPAMLGRETASRPTARGTLAVIAQGEQKFGLLAARVQRIFSDLITMTRQYYEEKMPQGLQKRILGKGGKPIWGHLSPEMIAGQYDCTMEVDLAAGDIAFEKQADQLIFQTMVQDPYINQNPSFAWEIRASYLKALGKKDIEKYIGPKPDMEMNAGDMEDENMMMMQEMEVEVDERDDDVVHMNSHSQFKREMMSALSGNALRIITLHILQHRMNYVAKLQQSAMMMGGGDAGTNDTQAGNTGMAGSPRYGAIQGPRIGQVQGQGTSQSGSSGQ